MTSNQLRYWELREKNRNNQAVEIETAKHNRATEANERQKNQWNYDIQNRTLQETNRSNLAREAENQRSNMANEALKAEQNQISWHQAYSARMNAFTNQQNAATNLKAVNETIRANAVREDQNQQSINETVKHDRATEENATLNTLFNKESADKQYQVQLQRLQLESEELAEKIRHNQASEAEITRKNSIDQEIAMLQLQQTKIRDSQNFLVGTINAVTGGMGNLMKGAGSLASAGVLLY